MSVSMSSDPLENIQVTLSGIFGIDRDSIGLSILCRLGDGGDWSWLCVLNAASDMALQTLVGNPSTTARQIVDGKASSLFFPDKRAAAKTQQYVPGLKDQPFRTSCHYYVNGCDLVSLLGVVALKGSWFRPIDPQVGLSGASRAA